MRRVGIQCKAASPVCDTPTKCEFFYREWTSATLLAQLFLFQWIFFSSKTYRHAPDDSMANLPARRRRDAGLHPCRRSRSEEIGNHPHFSLTPWTEFGRGWLLYGSRKVVAHDRADRNSHPLRFAEGVAHCSHLPGLHIVADCCFLSSTV